jgi:hypothetical protein
MNIKKVDVNTLCLPEGQYFITDPCYVIKDDGMWKQVCDLLDWESLIVVLEINGHLIPIMSTAYGDGSYPVYKDGVQVGQFGVDAGLFAIFPDNNTFGFPGERLGVKVDLKGELFYEDGDAEVGDVEVFTSENDPYIESEW